MKKYWGVGIILFLVMVGIILSVYINLKSPTQGCGNCPQINMKDEYRRGEFINASINFSQKIYVGPSEWSLFKYENGQWKTLIINLGMLGCSWSQYYCGEPSYPPAPPYLGCIEVNATQIRTYSWDQRVEKSKTIECLHHRTHELVNWTCGYDELVETGRYKIRFEYTTDCPVENQWGMNTTIKYLEKEFSIV